MARTLEQLQKQYNKAASDKRRGSMMPGRPGRGPVRFDPKQRPKISRDTIKRLLSYLSPYKGRLVLVLLFMLLSTVASILGTSSVARIIDALTPNADGSPKVLSLFAGTPFEIAPGDTLGYILAIIAILASIYVVGIACTYLQSRIMLTISRDATEKIRNELFDKLHQAEIMSVREYRTVSVPRKAVAS